VQCEFFTHIVRYSKDQKAKVHKNRQNGHAGNLVSSTPSTGGGKGTGYFSVNFSPKFSQFVIKEPFELPGDHTHIGRRAHRQTIRPEHILFCSIIHFLDPYLNAFHPLGTLCHKVCHLFRVSSA
jgi:hypothetical protein